MLDTLHMKISATVKEELRKMAATENRSMSNYIETVLKRHVEEKNNAKVQ